MSPIKIIVVATFELANIELCRVDYRGRYFRARKY